jgi:protein-tyrosine phosphatase
MAEGVFRELVNEAGLSDKINVDSAGTASYHVGEKAHQGTRDVLRRNDIDYDGRARQFTVRDLSDFDYVLAMDKSNLEDIQRQVTDATDAHVGLFLQEANDAGTVNTLEVPDPYYTDNFDHVYDLVRKGSKALLSRIREEHNLYAHL